MAYTRIEKTAQDMADLIEFADTIGSAATTIGNWSSKIYPELINGWSAYEIYYKDTLLAICLDRDAVIQCNFSSVAADNYVAALGDYIGAEWIETDLPISNRYMVHTKSEFTGIENVFVAKSQELAEQVAKEWKSLMVDFYDSDTFADDWDGFMGWLEANDIEMSCNEDQNCIYLPQGFLIDNFGKFYKVNLVADIVSDEF